jgi:hypothetical protein
MATVGSGAPVFRTRGSRTLNTRQTSSNTLRAKTRSGFFTKKASTISGSFAKANRRSTDP